MTNPLETERSIRRAIESLNQASNHVSGSDVLCPGQKVSFQQRIQEIERDLLLASAKAKAA